MNREREFKIKEIEKLNEDEAIGLEHMSALSMWDKILGIISVGGSIYSIGDLFYKVINNDIDIKSSIYNVVLFSLCSFLCLYKHYDKEKTINEIVDKEYNKILLNKKKN